MFVQKLMHPLSRTTLLRTLAGEAVATEEVPSRIEFEAVSDALRASANGLKGSELDRAWVEPLHRTLRRLTRAEAGDIRMWHWMAAVGMPDLVWIRWRPEGVPTEDELPVVLSDAIMSRFAGGTSLAGTSRNTFARLYWLGESVNGDYETARWILSRQDMFQAIFERLFGLYPPAVTACLNRFRDRDENEVRAATKWLNSVGSSTVLESLNETEIARILDEAFDNSA